MSANAAPGPTTELDHSATIARLLDALGPDVIHAGDRVDIARHRQDMVNTMPDHIIIPAIAYPRSTDDVSRVLAICNEGRMPVVPQGGLTGLAAGALADRPALLLSLERLRGIEELDPDGRTITVLAGTVLETVQTAADEADLFFPLDLGGRGTAQVGGNASTNAGGNRVLRYGMMRDSVLGLEAVLPDGTVITSLNRMLKNNAGYDLKHLFIGSEGTLGVITRLVLRLFPKPRSQSTALVKVADFAGALALLREANAALGGNLAAFELMWPEFYGLGTTALGRTPPMPGDDGIMVLVESLGSDAARDPERFEEVVTDFLERGVIADAVLAQSERQRRELWAIRDCPGEFAKAGHWPQMGFDISFPIGSIGAFADMMCARLKERWPDLVTVRFGHLGDSNLHLSLRDPSGSIPEVEIEAFVYEHVGQWGGSITAEHGIGSLKREFLHHSRTPAEIALMKTLKAAIDPNGILNPGKVI